MKICLLIAAAMTACISAPKAAAPPCKTFDLNLPECGALYESKLIECTATSPTRAESERCEDDLRTQYKRPPLDGGAR